MGVLPASHVENVQFSSFYTLISFSQAKIILQTIHLGSYNRTLTTGTGVLRTLGFCSSGAILFPFVILIVLLNWQGIGAPSSSALSDIQLTPIHTIKIS